MKESDDNSCENQVKYWLIVKQIYDAKTSCFEFEAQKFAEFETHTWLWSATVFLYFNLNISYGIKAHEETEWKRMR